MSDEPVVIDGLSENIGPFYVPGSCAVYANHSSRPNARIDKRHGGMWLVASEPIAAGQEIRFDFTEAGAPAGGRAARDEGLGDGPADAAATSRGRKGAAAVAVLGGWPGR